MEASLLFITHLKFHVQPSRRSWVLAGVPIHKVVSWFEGLTLVQEMGVPESVWSSVIWAGALPLSCSTPAKEGASFWGWQKDRIPIPPKPTGPLPPWPLLFRLITLLPHRLFGFGDDPSLVWNFFKALVYAHEFLFLVGFMADMWDTSGSTPEQDGKASYLISLCRCFLTCKMGIIMVST